MEIKRFEQELIAQLEKRQIQPSAESWEKLDARLKSTHRKKNRRWWFGAAAAAVAAVIVSVFLLNPNKTVSPGLVQEPVEEQFTKPEQERNFVSPVEIASEASEEDRVEPSKEQSNTEVASVIKDQKEVSEEKTSVYVKTNSEETNAVATEEKENEFSEEIEELLATVSAEESGGNTVSDAEIDALLAEAAAEIEQEETLAAPEIHADILLAEVEDEIYQSFKEKVFVVLKEGFVKAKTAVANRNN